MKILLYPPFNQSTEERRPVDLSDLHLDTSLVSVVFCEMSDFCSHLSFRIWVKVKEGEIDITLPLLEIFGRN